MRRTSLTQLPVDNACELAAKANPAKALHLKKKTLLDGAQARRSFSAASLAALAERLGANLQSGLSPDEVQAKLKEHGLNLLQQAEGKTFTHILWEQINALNLLVTLSGILCLLRGTTICGVTLGKEPDHVNGTIILVINAICIGVGAYMEWSCAQMITDVNSLSVPQCTVMRDGAEQMIDTAQVVPGDLVILQTGNVIPADCRVVEAVDLQTGEMALTGEPHEVPKKVIADDPTSPFPSNMLYATTSVLGGSGKGLVTETGMRTEIGKIAKSLNIEETGLTQLQITLGTIANMISILVLALVALIFLVSLRMRVNDPADPCKQDDTSCFVQKSLLRALFCAVGAIPETLQPACMLLLVVGIHQLKTKNAACRRIDAIDTLGACSYICSDKTGTLTEGRMTAMCLLPRVRPRSDASGPAIAALGKAGAVANAARRLAFYPTRGYDPAGSLWDTEELTDDVKALLDGLFAAPGRPRGAAAARVPVVDYGDPGSGVGDAQLARSCLAALHLSNYGTQLLQEDGEFKIHGNMSEGALVVACAKARLQDEALRDRYPRQADLEVPFSSSRKMMATVHALPEAGTFEALDLQAVDEEPVTHLAVLKGAPDVLLPSLQAVLQKGILPTAGNDDGRFAVVRGFAAEDAAWFEAENQALASKAYRVLCVAARPLSAKGVEDLKSCNGNGSEILEKLMSGGLVLLALVGLMDPPRASVRQAVATCHNAGIRVAMVTGDQRATAVAIAKDLGILQGDDEDISWVASECAALKGAHKEQIDHLCGHVRVWSRAQPADKVTIVESLQRQGHIVAMTGDGTNDAGALKKANIGVAMGIAGTDVAKGASDVILLDDCFATIVDAIAEGRRIFENIQRMSTYLLCGNVYDIIAVMLSMTLGWAVPLEETQLFKAQFLTHWFYPWVMIYQGASFYSMMHPPRDRGKLVVPGIVQKILMPACLVLYTSGLLVAQYAGAALYVGPVSLEEQLGTDSLSLFYDGRLSYICLYANTLSFVPNTNAPAEEVYRRDVAPLHCRARRLYLSGTADVLEWGRLNKSDPAVAIETGDFDSYQGSWFGQNAFSLNSSFLRESFHGEAKSFMDRTWTDPRGWLVKCDNITYRSSDSEVLTGDNDKLCWRQCGSRPCWQEALLPAQGNSTAAKEEAQEEATQAAEAVVEEDEPDAKPVLYKKFNAGAWGCRQMRSVVLVSMVTMQALMLFALSKHECSLMYISGNLLFLGAWVVIAALLASFVYVPVTWFDQGFAPLDALGLGVAVGIAVVFYLFMEATKGIFRAYFLLELFEKAAVAKLLAEGRLRAFCSRREAFATWPERQPIVFGEGPDENRGGPLNGNYNSIKLKRADIAKLV